jgi:sulfite reductase (NADPH) hemoprotein beta-component
MYLYTDFDQQLINQRVAQFRDQTERYLAGKLTEDEYRPLRLQNGLYVQRYAPMLRIAVPYGLMNTKQLKIVKFRLNMIVVMPTFQLVKIFS